MKWKRISFLVALISVIFLLFLFPYAVYAGWEQSENGEWSYRNEKSGELEKDKWLLDNGKWYYIGTDGLMYKNQWLKDANGEKIAWFLADGSLGQLAHPTEAHGPGIELNRILYSDSESEDFKCEKVKLNNDFMTGLSEKERRLFDYILENYKVDDEINGVYGQNLFIVLNTNELAEILELEIIEQNGIEWVSLDKVNEAIKNIDLEVKKETNQRFFRGTECSSLNPSSGITESVYLVINSHSLSHITNLKHLNELINNVLVRKLKIEDGITSQKEAARKIYYWICSEFQYDLEMMNADLLTCWATRKGICWSFAGLYKKMCNMCGIQCDIEGGSDYLGEEYGHVWNSNEIDGIRSFTDDTWGISSNSAEASTEQLNRFFKMNRIELDNSHLRFILVK